MDGQPDEVDPAEAADRAQWERARQVREAREAQEHQRSEGRAIGEVPAPAPPAGASKRWAVVAVAVAAVFVLAAGVMVVVIRRHSDQQPAWVAQLGLDTGVTNADRPPARLGTPEPGDTADSSVAGSAVPSSPPAADDAPTIDTTGENFDHVYRQIETLEGWLLTDPQPDRVAEIYQPGTAPYADLVTQLTQLRDAHETLHVENYRIIGVTVDSRPAPDRVELRYADTFTDAVTTAAGSGAVVSRVPYDGRARLWTLTLQRGDDGHWRVAATAFVRYGDVVPPS